jgi:hypothetical protein
MNKALIGLFCQLQVVICSLKASLSSGGKRTKASDLGAEEAF